MIVTGNSYKSHNMYSCRLVATTINRRLNLLSFHIFLNFGGDFRDSAKRLQMDKFKPFIGTKMTTSNNIYVTAAFKTEVENEAYIFMKNEYVKMNYAPGGTNDKILCGPARVTDFPSLRDTVFADGIDCAFGSHNSGEAYLFASTNCAKWIYPSDSRADYIIQGPIPITEMFPFLNGTVFENGVDAAFESSREYEAYLFKDDFYALINYGTEDPKLIAYHFRKEYWPCFDQTILENGRFSAAMASHREREAYIFKEFCYACIRFTPGETEDELLSEVKTIKGNWAGLGDILPR